MKIILSLPETKGILFVDTTCSFTEYSVRRFLFKYNRDINFEIYDHSVFKLEKETSKALEDKIKENVDKVN